MFNNFLISQMISIWWLQIFVYVSYVYYTFNRLVAAMYGYGRCECATAVFAEGGDQCKITLCLDHTNQNSMQLFVMICD